MIAARSLGLDCGPMGGFSREGVDKEFFLSDPRDEVAGAPTSSSISAMATTRGCVRARRGSISTKPAGSSDAQKLAIMLVLGINTVADACEAALVRDGAVVAELSEPMKQGHDARLAPVVEQLMREAGIAFADLDRVAVDRRAGLVHRRSRRRRVCARACRCRSIFPRSASPASKRSMACRARAACSACCLPSAVRRIAPGGAS